MDYHFFYRTTCLITGKYYFGIHSTDDLDDGYLGSGKILQQSLKKHGKENHIREILNFFLSRETLQEHEIKFVNDDCVKDQMCMNLALGGAGFAPGHTHSNETLQKIASSLKGRKHTKKTLEKFRGRASPMKGKVLTEKQKEKIAESCKGRVPWNKGKKLSADHRHALSEAALGRPSPMRGKKHSREARRRMSEAHRHG